MYFYPVTVDWLQVIRIITNQRSVVGGAKVDHNQENEMLIRIIICCGDAVLSVNERNLASYDSKTEKKGID